MDNSDKPDRYAKYEEYKQVAALACYLIDILDTIAEDNLSAEELKRQINDIKEQKDEIINNPRKREERYEIICMLLNLAR